MDFDGSYSLFYSTEATTATETVLICWRVTGRVMVSVPSKDGPPKQVEREMVKEYCMPAEMIPMEFPDAVPCDLSSRTENSNIVNDPTQAEIDASKAAALAAFTAEFDEVGAPTVSDSSSNPIDVQLSIVAQGSCRGRGTGDAVLLRRAIPLDDAGDSVGAGDWDLWLFKRK